MDIGAFTVCLTVKDLEKSYAFYQKLGFEKRSGDISQKWIVVMNGNAAIGLFQGLLDQNMLTFIPGWDQKGNEVGSYTDIREIQKELKANGVMLTSEADEKGQGPASFALEDPDGNQILFDQYR